MSEPPRSESPSPYDLFLIPPPPPLSPEDGLWLLRVACETLQRHFQGLGSEDPAHRPGPVGQPASVFVSVYSSGSLRGCLGALEPSEPIWRSVQRMVLAAASVDPRFEPIQASETGTLSVEITVLGPRTDLPRTTPEDTLRAIRIGEHGLSVRAEGRSGLLLPQVGSRWGWDARRFLEETCKKAGLPGDAWLLIETEVRAFQGIKFHGDVGPSGLAGESSQLV